MAQTSRVRRSVLAAAATLSLISAVFIVAQTRSRVVYEGEGRFGTVRVVERADGVRELYFNDGPGRQSALDPRAPRRLELSYSRVAMLGPALVPPDARILFVGLGGGSMPTYLHDVEPKVQIDVVEIDPLVVDVARTWFGFRSDARMRVQVADGRAFLEAAPGGSYDLIVLDAFSDAGIPRALATRAFLEAVRAALSAGGVVASNLHTSVDEYPAMVATYQAVFDEVVEIDVQGRRQRILLASGPDRTLGREALLAAARRWADRVHPDFDLTDLVDGGFHVPEASGAPVLEDDRGVVR